jgi:trans-aconitate 2-methyltransferase
VTATWDAGLYAANTAHHRRHDERLLGSVGLPPGARVLDIGCGVGDFTARLTGLADGVEVLGLDADPGMVAAATERYGSAAVRFAVGRAQDLAAAVPAGSVDAVFSVAALHWVPAADHPAVLAGVRSVLRPGGFLRAEFGGAGQIAAVRPLLDEESARLGGGPAAWFFPTPQEYGVLPAAAGLAADRLELVRQRRSFPTAADLLGWLRSQTYPAYRAGLPDGAMEEFSTRVEARAEAELGHPDGTYDLEFVRLDLLARPA